MGLQPRQPAPLSTGELSRRTGVGVETIRYYERIGMLPPPPRSIGGRRLYEPAATRRLAFIRRSRELGFRLGEIRALLALSEAGGRARCPEARALAFGHLALIRSRIADLQAAERVLADAIERCDRDERPGCPVIDALSVALPVRRRDEVRAT
jgi:MerR family mercuric resistance operon transcriptional regulator